MYYSTPLICIAVLLVPLSSQEREILQYSSHLYRSTPPICIAIRRPFVSQYAAHLHHNASGKILAVVVTGKFPISVGVGKRGLLEKGSFQKSPFFRDSREFRDPRDSREPPDCGKQRRFRPFSRDSRELEILEILEIPLVKRPLLPFPISECPCYRNAAIHRFVLGNT